jgi:outer membrane protein OmpA-like peptidoglycan-associated protein
VTFGLGLAIVASGCASTSKAPSETVPPGRANASTDLVVLLRDDDGSVGRAIVSNDHGSADLATAGGLTTVSANAAPAAERTMTDREIQEMFGGVLSTLPAPPERFTMLFQFESDVLTPEGGQALPAIFAAVKRHPAATVTVVGHADSAGPSRPNFELGLRRAHRIRDLLVAAGVDASCIEVSSRGETDPAVRPGDQVFERRNRRVDVIVR